MKKFYHLVSCAIIAAAMGTSCNTPKNIAYFQDISNGQTLQPQTVYDIRVKPDDKISIIVNTQDPALSSLFNLVLTQNRLTAFGKVGDTNTTGYSESRSSYYTVDSEGDINFPVLGTLHIGGMKRSEIARYIEKRLINDDLVKDPIVTVEFINTGFSVLGEVAKPGRYEFNKDRMSIMEALAMAGDLKNTGLRENVVVVRQEGPQQKTYVVDLTDTQSLVKSPAYYLQQDDVIYVEPNDKSKRETTSSGNTLYNPSFWVSIGSIGISVATLIVTITNK